MEKKRSRSPDKEFQEFSQDFAIKSSGSPFSNFNMSLSPTGKKDI